MNATARAQAHEALEQAALALKRQQRLNREALQLVRQAQVGLLGVEIETLDPSTTQPEGGQGAEQHTQAGQSRDDGTRVAA